jgi:hypothetical protein
MLGRCGAADRMELPVVAMQPDTFYFGSVGGGVWKTENAGRTWFPISDEGIPIGSIGAVAVAPSDPDVVCGDRRTRHSQSALLWDQNV